MKKNRSKIMVLLLILVLVFASFPVVAVAANSDDGAGYIQIDTFTTGSLSAAVSAVQTSPAVTKLIITNGDLNSTDIAYVSGLPLLTWLEIKDSATIIGGVLPDNTFSGTAIELVKIDSITQIGVRAFQNCGSLAWMEFINAETIGDYAFQNCTNLTSSNYLPAVTTIGVQAFDGCTSLSDITVPNITGLANHAFNGCVMLSNFMAGYSVPTIGSGTFSGVPSSRWIYVPLTMVDTYDAAEGPVNDGLWYGWTITGIDDDATLSSLVFTGHTMSPAFSSGVFEYTFTVGNDVSSVDFIPTTSSKTAMIILEPNVLMSGTTITRSLNVGENVFELDVYSGFITMNTYKITITREAATGDGDETIDETEGEVENPETGVSHNNSYFVILVMAVLMLKAVLIKKQQLV